MNETRGGRIGSHAQAAKTFFAAAAALAAWSCAFATPADAQEVSERVENHHVEASFVLPFELGQGPRFDGAGDGFAWAGQASLLPGVRFAGAELSGLLSAVYAGKDGDALLGARASHVLLPFLQGTIALRLAVQGAYAVRAKNGDGGVGVIGDLAGILRLGLWAGRDFERKRFYALITVGSDLLTWGDPVGAIVKAGPMEDVGDGR